MKLCFYQRLSLAAITIFVLMTSAFLWWSNQMQNITRNEAEQQLHVALAQHLVQDNPLLQEGVFDYDALSNLFHTLMVMGPNFEFYYLDDKGKILTYNAQPGKVKSKHVALNPIRDLLNDTQPLPIYGTDPKNPTVSKIFSAAPVYKDNALQGYLYVIIGGERYDSIVSKLSNDQTYSQFILLGIATLVLFLISMVVFFKYLTKPMKTLTVAMETVRDADYDLTKSRHERLEWNRDSIDEIQKLGCAFNDMVDHIQEQFDVLQELDSRRRGLLADLSHDLRTPLANLQGYIETLAINNQNLTEQDRERFVHISLKNAQNLKHLIDQIFELAYIEAGQVKITRERFPIGELIHDVAAKFDLKAREHGIKLKVEPEKVDCQVYADIGKLERVLTNLIENAIRHTPEGGNITLLITPGNAATEVAVIDTGVGIDKQELAFIFEARYQATNNQKDRTLHAGLGLAICQKLMALAGSELRVSSELGLGTRFYFSLPTNADC